MSADVKHLNASLSKRNGESLSNKALAAGDDYFHVLFLVEFV